MKILSPGNWKDYELLDSGGLEKLERFGKYILARPEPQAVWIKGLSEGEWDQMAHARYRRLKGNDPSKNEPGEKGEWTRLKKISDHWNISYRHLGMDLKFRLGLTSFGHTGIFPEQSVNWDYIYDNVDLMKQSVQDIRVLNLFAYTGGSSFAARAAGAGVVHVDSVRTTVSWAREIMEQSGLEGIRWVVEDAMKFVKREVRRGNRYHGIILDPPAYGRGPEGEKWILQEMIAEMIASCQELLYENPRFFVLSMYSMGLSPLIAENLAKICFGELHNYESGELCIPDQQGRKLPLGTYLRFRDVP